MKNLIKQKPTQAGGTLPRALARESPSCRKITQIAREKVVIGRHITSDQAIPAESQFLM